MTEQNETEPTPSATAEQLITVDVWTDVVCPWCYIRESRLQDAIEAESLSGRVHIRAHSFELDPTSPIDSVRDNISHLAVSKGMDEEQVHEMEAQIKGMAEEIGREYVTERPMASTRGGHRTPSATKAFWTSQSNGPEHGSAPGAGPWRARTMARSASGPGHAQRRRDPPLERDGPNAVDGPGRAQ